MFWLAGHTGLVCLCRRERDELRLSTDELTLACSAAMRREREAVEELAERRADALDELAERAGVAEGAAQSQPQPAVAAAQAVAAAAAPASAGGVAARLTSLEAEPTQPSAAEAAAPATAAAGATSIAREDAHEAKVRALEAKLRRVGAQLAKFTQAMGAADLLL